MLPAEELAASSPRRLIVTLAPISYGSLSGARRHLLTTKGVDGARILDFVDGRARFVLRCPGGSAEPLSSLPPWDALVEVGIEGVVDTGDDLHAVPTNGRRPSTVADRVPSPQSGADEEPAALHAPNGAQPRAPEPMDEKDGIGVGRFGVGVPVPPSRQADQRPRRRLRWLRRLLGRGRTPRPAQEEGSGDLALPAPEVGPSVGAPPDAPAGLVASLLRLCGEEPPFASDPPGGHANRHANGHAATSAPTGIVERGLTLLAGSGEAIAGGPGGAHPATPPSVAAASGPSALDHHRADPASPSPEPVEVVRTVEDTEPAPLLALAEALTDSSDEVRTAARVGLDAIDSELARAWAGTALRTGPLAEATAAASLVGVLGLQDLGGEMFERAADVHPSGRGPFVDALRSLDLDGAAVAALVGTVSHSRRHEAVRVASEALGSELIDHLSGLLRDPSSQVRLAVLDVIAATGAADEAFIVASDVLASDTSATVRAGAVRLLRLVDPDSRLTLLAGAVHDSEPEVREAAIELLTERSATDSPSHDETALLAAAATDSDDGVQTAAVQRLVALAAHDPSALWNVLRDSDPDETGAAIVEIVHDLAPEQLGLLAASFVDAPDVADRILAVRLASRAGTVASTELVVERLADPGAEVRLAAAAALAKSGVPDAVLPLVRLLGDLNEAVRAEAVRALSVFDDDRAAAGLVASLADPAPAVRHAAASVLEASTNTGVNDALVDGIIGFDAAGPALAALAVLAGAGRAHLYGPSGSHHGDAVDAIGRLLERRVGAAPFLAQAGAPQALERRRAVEALGAIGGAEAAATLTRRLADPDAAVRLRALGHLARLRDPRAVEPVRQIALTDPFCQVAAVAQLALIVLEQPSGPS